MTRIFRLALVICIAAAGCTSDGPATVNITVHLAQDVPQDDTVFVTGSTEELGYWRPNAVPLQRVDSTRWEGELSVVPISPVEFKVTRGGWHTEAVLADGSVPDNFRLVVRGDTALAIRVEGWKDVSGADAGQITGQVEYIRDVPGDGIPSRDLVVWLPPSYDSASEKRYPVLYVHDGQNIFDPATSFTGIDWQIDEHVDSLSRAGRMQEIIVVGVYNTTARSEEYDMTEKGEAYLTFLVDTVKPRIDGRYRTLRGREHTGVMGASMGGTISFVALWRHSDVFSRAACLSPFFPNTLPRRVMESGGWDTADSHLYVDNGGDEVDARLQMGIDRMLPVLREVGFVEGRNFEWHRFRDARHNERQWARRVWRPLLFMFGSAESPPIR